MLGREAADLGSLHFCHAAGRIGSALRIEVEQWLKDHPETKLIVLDTLASVRNPMQGRSNMYQSDTEDGHTLQQLAFKHQLALFAIHHLRKRQQPRGVEDILEEVSGTTGITGTADTILVLRRSRGSSEGSLYVTSRDMPE